MVLMCWCRIASYPCKPPWVRCLVLLAGPALPGSPQWLSGVGGGAWTPRGCDQSCGSGACDWLLGAASKQPIGPLSLAPSRPRPPLWWCVSFSGTQPPFLLLSSLPWRAATLPTPTQHFHGARRRGGDRRRAQITPGLKQKS